MARIPAPLASVILRRLQARVAAARPPDLTITGLDPSRPYLRRWWLVRRTWTAGDPGYAGRTPPRWGRFNAYLHQFLRSDDDRALHCHPWASVSIILSGGYFEHTQDGRRTWHGPGSIIARGPGSPHRVELPLTTVPEAGGAAGAVEAPAWTLFLTGDKVREWGFWCSRGWIHWKDFATTNPDGSNAGGVSLGCDGPVTPVGQPREIPPWGHPPRGYKPTPFDQGPR